MTRTLPSPKLLVTGGAVLLASAAYAVGTQASGGTAGAATSAPPPASRSAHAATGATGSADRPGRPGGPKHRSSRDLAGAATALGVSEGELRAALEEVRPTREGKADRRGALAAALAESLGIDAPKVGAALDAQRPAPPAGGERPRRAARETGRRGAGRRGPDPGRRGPGRGLDAAALATTLGVAEAKVTAALTAFRAAERQRHEARRTAWVERLAAELGVSEAKVGEVLGQMRPGPGRGRGSGRP